MSRMVARSHTKKLHSLTVSELRRYEAGFASSVFPPIRSPGVSQCRRMCRPSRSSKKYLPRPLISKNRRSAGPSWFVMTDLAANRRGCAAARILLRSCRLRPSKKLDLQSVDTGAIPGLAIGFLSMAETRRSCQQNTLVSRKQQPDCNAESSLHGRNLPLNNRPEPVESMFAQPRPGPHSSGNDLPRVPPA